MGLVTAQVKGGGGCYCCKCGGVACKLGWDGKGRAFLPFKGRAIAYEPTPSFIVTLNLFQGPFLVSNSGFGGRMDAEPQASAAKRVQHDEVK